MPKRIAAFAARSRSPAATLLSAEIGSPRLASAFPTPSRNPGEVAAT